MIGTIIGSLSIGFILGFICSALMSVSGDCNRTQDSYNIGFENGRKYEANLNKTEENANTENE